MNRAWFLLFVFLPVLVLAGPKGAIVQIDTFQVFKGTFYEGKSNFIEHTFTYKNIGDSTLKISSIRPGCDCESVSADTVLDPGKTGRISVRIDLRGLREREFDKYVIINSNARNLPRMKFIVRAKIRGFIDFDPVSVVLPTMDKKDTTQIIKLFTDKNDLQVSDVYFQPDSSSAGWGTRVPVRFSFSNTGKKTKDGRMVYALTVCYFPVRKESLYGAFVVKTNHPEKPEFIITGVLDPKK